MLIYSVYPNNNHILNKISEIYHSDSIIKKFKTNVLCSYYYLHKKESELENVKKLGNSILIDSGAFSFANKNETTNFDIYIYDYRKFIKKNDSTIFKGFFELDIGKLISYSKVKEYRENLFEVTDKIIPVWHKYLGKDEFKLMCKEYKYIAIGGVVHGEIQKDELAPYLKHAIKKGVKLHCLGLGDRKYLDKLPFYSTDTLTYNRAMRGRRARFQGTNHKITYIQKGSLKEKQDSYALYDWIYGVKFNNHYYNYWNNKKIV